MAAQVGEGADRGHHRPRVAGLGVGQVAGPHRCHQQRTHLLGEAGDGREGIGVAAMTPQNPLQQAVGLIVGLPQVKQPPGVHGGQPSTAEALEVHHHGWSRPPPLLLDGSPGKAAVRGGQMAGHVAQSGQPKRQPGRRHEKPPGAQQVTAQHQRAHLPHPVQRVLGIRFDPFVRLQDQPVHGPVGVVIVVQVAPERQQEDRDTLPQHPRAHPQEGLHHGLDVHGGIRRGKPRWQLVHQAPHLRERLFGGGVALQRGRRQRGDRQRLHRSRVAGQHEVPVVEEHGISDVDEGGHKAVEPGDGLQLSQQVPIGFGQRSSPR